MFHVLPTRRTSTHNLAATLSRLSTRRRRRHPTNRPTGATTSRPAIRSKPTLTPNPPAAATNESPKPHRSSRFKKTPPPANPTIHSADPFAQTSTSATPCHSDPPDLTATENRPIPKTMSQHTPDHPAPENYPRLKKPLHSKATRSCNPAASDGVRRHNPARQVPGNKSACTARPSELRSDRVGAALRPEITHVLTCLRCPPVRDDELLHSQGHKTMNDRYRWSGNVDRPPPASPAEPKR
jgi:hypothetical protein